jgi:hypothetical protein
MSVILDGHPAIHFDLPSPVLKKIFDMVAAEAQTV